MEAARRVRLGFAGRVVFRLARQIFRGIFIEAEIFAGSATRVVEMTGEACVFAGGIW